MGVGVRALVAEGNAFAEKAGLAAGTYYETDQYVKGAFKVAVNASIGNPYASEEEVQKMGWGRSPRRAGYGLQPGVVPRGVGEQRAGLEGRRP
ncbi:hypothetical protein ACFQ3Z_29140 [Streptomyces nogalater]